MKETVGWIALILALCSGGCRGNGSGRWSVGPKLSNNCPGTPAPVLVSSAIDPIGATEIIYSHQTDICLDSPGKEGRLFKFKVTTPPGYTESSVYPTEMILHAFGESFDMQSPESADKIVIFPDDPENTFWYGYSDQLPAGDPNKGTVVNYTERRLLYYLDFVSKNFAVDQNRIFLSGSSMGGSGTVSFGLSHPEIFAGFKAENAPVNQRYQRITTDPESENALAHMEGLWGHVSMGVHNYDGFNVWDWMDISWRLEHVPGSRESWLHTYHGKDDHTVWFTQSAHASEVTGMNFFQAEESFAIGHYAVWDEGGHRHIPDPVMSTISPPPPGSSSVREHWWDNDWDPTRDTETYLKHNLSFPAFSHFSYNNNPGIGTCVVGGPEPMCSTPLPADYSGYTDLGNVPLVLGTHTYYNGDWAGVINRHLRWNSNAIIDTLDLYSIDVKILNNDNSYSACLTYPTLLGCDKYPKPMDNYVGSGTETVDITPRRLQQFVIAANETVLWSSSGGQSGTVTADSNGVVTVPKFQVTTAWRTLTLTRSPG
jgi:hypothetical protein